MNKKSIGNIFALFTMIVWGTTFIATKKLLVSFTPIEILFFRFFLSFIALFIVYPKVFIPKNIKHELVFAMAGLTGYVIYQFLENTALTYTLASNVSIITSLAPFFTAIFVFTIYKDEKLTKNFFIGFAISMIGIVLVSLNGMLSFKFDWRGDLLAFLAVIVWGIYSLISKIASKYEYNMIQVTRRITMYAVIFILPIFFLTNSSFELSRFKELDNVLLMAFLGIVASAIGFYSWNIAIKYIGAVKTTNYIYGIPVVTIIFAAIFLKETINIMGFIGAVFTIFGLVISNFPNHKKETTEN